MLLYRFKSEVGVDSGIAIRVCEEENVSVLFIKFFEKLTHQL